MKNNRRVSAFLCVSLFVFALPAAAERIFTCGFEENNFTETMWQTVAGATIVTTGTPHAGTYHIRFQNDIQSVHRNFSNNFTSGSMFTRFYLKFVTRPSSNGHAFEWRNSSDAAGTRITFLSASNSLRLTNVVTGTNADGSQALSTNTWYRVELRTLLADTGGELELRLYTGDSTSALETLSITNEDTLSSNVRWAVYQMGVAVTHETYIDDIAVNTSSGTFQTSWPGPGKIALMKPTSDDTVTWTKTGANCSGTTNTDCVDDLPGTPDDASGYNSSATANNEDRLNLTALPAEVPSDADMILMDVYDRWDGNGTTGTRQGRALLWDEGGAQTNGPTHARCDVAAGNWSIPIYTQKIIFDLGTRTKANVNSFDLGYEPLNNAECRVTALWANVEWIEAPPAGAARRRVIAGLRLFLLPAAQAPAQQRALLNNSVTFPFDSARICADDVDRECVVRFTLRNEAGRDVQHVSVGEAREKSGGRFYPDGRPAFSFPYFTWAGTTPEPARIVAVMLHADAGEEILPGWSVTFSAAGRPSSAADGKSRIRRGRASPKT